MSALLVGPSGMNLYAAAGGMVQPTPSVIFTFASGENKEQQHQPQANQGFVAKAYCCIAIEQGPLRGPRM